jgi:hypothetical protein
VFPKSEKKSSWNSGIFFKGRISFFFGGSGTWTIVQASSGVVKGLGSTIKGSSLGVFSTTSFGLSS